MFSKERQQIYMMMPYSLYACRDSCRCHSIYWMKVAPYIAQDTQEPESDARSRTHTRHSKFYKTRAKIRPKCVPKWISGSEIFTTWDSFLHLGRGRVLEATAEGTMLSSKTQHQAFGEKDIKGLFVFLKYCYASMHRDFFVFHIHSTFFLWASDVLKAWVWVRRDQNPSILRSHTTVRAVLQGAQNNHSQWISRAGI